MSSVEKKTLTIYEKVEQGKTISWEEVADEAIRCNNENTRVNPEWTLAESTADGWYICASIIAGSDSSRFNSCKRRAEKKVTDWEKSNCEPSKYGTGFGEEKLKAIGQWWCYYLNTEVAPTPTLCLF